MVVVLPAPFAPRKPKIVPGAIVNDRSQTASVSPNDLLRRSRRMAGSLMNLNCRGDRRGDHLRQGKGAWHKRLYILDVPSSKWKLVKLFASPPSKNHALFLSSFSRRPGGFQRSG